MGHCRAGLAHLSCRAWHGSGTPRKQKISLSTDEDEKRGDWENSGDVGLVHRRDDGGADEGGKKTTW